MRVGFEQHCGLSAAIHLLHVSLLSSLVSSFVNRVTCSVKNKATGNRARLSDVVAEASDNLELDLGSILELLHAVLRWGRMCTGSSETSKMPSSVLLVH